MRFMVVCMPVIMVVAGTGSAHAAARVVTIYNTGRTDGPPVIDGRLADECWRGRPVITNMVLRDKGQRTPAGLQTETTVVYDDQALYVGMRLAETNPEALRKNCVAYDGDIWWDDSVELYVGPGTSHREYFKFITNPIGTRHDVRGIQAGYLFVMQDWGTGTGWETKAFVGTDFWSLEFRIPWADFETAPPEPGDVWMFEPVRFRYANADGTQRGIEYSSWNVGASYNRPQNFGNMVFSGDTHDLQALLRDKLAPALGDDLLLYGPSSETRYRQGTLTTTRYAAIKDQRVALLRRTLAGLRTRLKELPASVPAPSRTDITKRLAKVTAQLEELKKEAASPGLAESLAKLQEECERIAWSMTYREKLAALPASKPLPAATTPGAVRLNELVEQEYALRPDATGVPVTRWLGEKPVGGKLSVLVLNGNPLVYEQHGRKLVELKRALDLEMEYAEVSWFAAGGAPVVDNERIQRFLAERRWDVIFIWVVPQAHCSGNPLDLLTDETKSVLLDAVAGKGTGLLFLQPDRPTELSDAAEPLALRGSDVFAGLTLLGRTVREGLYRGAPQDDGAYKEKILTGYQIGKGRCVVLDCNQMSLAPGGGLLGRTEALPWSPENRTDGEYGHAELARALLAAAGREPRVVFTDAPAGIRELALGDTAGKALKWTLDARKAPSALTLTMRVRDLTGAVVHSRTRTPSRANVVTAMVDLPELGAGRYYADLFVDSSAGREAFGYAALRVAAQVKVAVALSRPGFEPGESITGNVTVAAAEAPSASRAPDRIVVRLVDGEHRAVGLTELVPRAGKKLPFALATTDLHGIPFRIEAEALAGGQRAGIGFANGNLLHRRQDRFNVVLWGNVVGPYAHWSLRSVARTGVTAMLSPEGASANMTFVPFSDTLHGEFRGKEYRNTVRRLTNPSPDANGVLSLQPAPWNDEAGFAEVLKLTDNTWRHGQRQPILCYNLYDEGPNSAMDMTPAGMVAYRTFLKEQYYGDLEALNTEWRSAYAAWDEVVALEQDESKARAQGNYGRWSDRTHFGQVNFSRTILAGFTKQARKVDPYARVGFEGSGGFGQDFDELFTGSGFWCPYDGLPLELVRSQRPDGYVYGFWTGYDKTAEPLLSQAWRMVVNGAPSVWWWMLPGTGTFHGWLARDDKPYPSGRRLVDECIMPLRQGLGDLLINLDQTHDGLGLYYSVASVHAGQVYGQDYNSMSGAAESLHKLIEDCGYQWLYFTKRNLLDGQPRKRGVKVLFLPFIQTLGRDEVDALRRFAEAGGTVIADLRPGVLSGHCRPVDHGPADELFGIRRTGPGKAEMLDGEATVDLDGAAIPLVLRNNRGDDDLLPTVAVAGSWMAGTPVFLVNVVGEGRAILLNYHLTQYNGRRDAAQGRQMRMSFRALATALGLKPRLVLTGEPGGEAPHPEVTTWRKGSVTVYSLFEGNGPVEAVLPQRAFVFDWQTGALGRTDRIRGDLRGLGSIRFFASYPYDPGQPRARASTSSIKGGETVQFDLAMSGVPAGEDGVFSYHTRLVDPTGRWVDVIPWSVQGAGGKAAVRIRFAHDDPAGVWALEVKEITTGRTTRATVMKVGRAE